MLTYQNRIFLVLRLYGAKRSQRTRAHGHTSSRASSLPSRHHHHTAASPPRKCVSGIGSPSDCVRYAGRAPSAATATGNKNNHKSEQYDLIDKALGVKVPH